MAEPLAYGLLRSAEHSALHMELRNSYTSDDADWLDWQTGRRFDPAERWASWYGLVGSMVERRNGAGQDRPEDVAQHRLLHGLLRAAMEPAEDRPEDGSPNLSRLTCADVA